MKRIPLAIVLGVLCFTAFSIFSQRHAAAKLTVLPQTAQQPGSPAAETQIARSQRSVISPDGKVLLESDAESDDVEFVPNEVLVKFKDENEANEVALDRRTSGGALSVSNARLNKIFARFGVAEGRKPFARGKSRVLSSVVKLTTRAADRKHLNELITDLRRQPEIEYAELNVIMKTQSVPNDTYYGTSGAWGQTFRDLWGLQAINAETAWDTSQGDNVVVAVVDTGLDYNHEDIANNVWQNDGEMGLDGSGNDKRSNAIDDDGDGLIDDWHGWDFVTIDGTPADNNPMDDFGHGTHVSGTIAATGNNGLGIIGVAPHAKIMALKGLDSNGSGSMEDLCNAIIYAADKGASVINNSWGGSGDTPQTLIDAIAYAHNIKGVVVVAAAGNSNWDVGTQEKGFYPACIRDVIAVAAVTHTDAKASFSNYGPKIDVAAPGGGDTDPTGLLVQPDRAIVSLLSSAASSTMTGSGQLVVGTKYLRQEGTSMASPHVAGLAALIRATHPEFSPEQVRQAIKQSADDIGAAGVDNQFGSGRINAARSLTVAAPLMTQLTGPTGILSGLTQVNVTGSVGGVNLANWRLEYGVGTAPVSWTQIATSTTTVTAGVIANWNLSSVSDGTYTLHLVAQNSTGQSFEDRMIVVLDSLIITDPAPFTLSIQRGGQAVVIKGTVAASNFARYGIGILAVGSNTWISNSAITIPNDGYQRVRNGVLATWDTTGAPGDSYQIYVTQIFTDNTSVYKSVRVVVDPTLHAGWPVDIGLLGNGIAGYALTNHLDAGDIDGNGSKELIVAYDHQIHVLSHTGSELPGWPQTIDPQNSGAHIQISPAVADLDGDGLPEIVAANDQGNIFIFRGDGTQWAGWPRHMAYWGTNIAVDDLNGDGQKEIITTTYASIRVFNTSGVDLPGWPVWNYAGNTPPAIGDVDGDGQKEIVVATLTGPTNLYILKANGTIMPGWPKAINPTLPSNYNANSDPVLGDLDGDGKLECVIGSSDGQVYAFRFDGSNQPGWPQATKQTGVNTPAIGDIDGDGLPEVVAGNDTLLEGYDHANYIFAWHADGTLLPNWPVKLDKPISGTFFGFGAPALVDLDQDGRADVIVTSDTSGSAPFALNAYKSDGSKVTGFPKPTLEIGSFSTNTVAVADLDNDGMLEMAWIDYSHHLYVWDLSAPNSAVAPWPMFQHDERHSGLSVRTPEVIAPAVSINSPANGTRVTGIVPVSVQAVDNVGVVKVELYKDGALIGTITASPYNFTWDTRAGADGLYSFTGKAYDAAGNLGTSAAVVLNVDNTAPTSNINAPVNGALLKGSAVTISANASDNSGIQKVDFYRDNNVLVGTDTTAPFSVNWDTLTASNAVHTVYVVATDTLGNSSTSVLVSVTVDNAPPTVALTSPVNGAKVGGTVPVTANATDNVGVLKVQFYRDSSVLLGTALSAPFTLNWNSTTVTAGAHTLYAIATDTAGNTATSAVSSVTVDNSAPTVSLTAPTNNAVVAGTTVALSATASDNVAVSKVDFYRDSNVLLGTDTTTPYGISWDSTSAASGSHTIFAVATDTAGNTKTSTVINVTVDNSGPVTILTAPANGGFVSGTAVAMTATASDNVAVSKVEFYRDGNVLLGTDTSSPYSLNWNSTTVTGGAHTLFVVAQDTSGNRTTSASVVVTVDNTAPTVAITSPANGAQVTRNTTVNIAANAADNIGVVKVEFYVNNALTCTDTTAAYTCSWLVPNTRTTFSLKATAYDAAGKTATHTISVTSK
ncbi:MAG: peptidase and in kexin sedolisin [Acidobacteria bacterium]|nr:peptidase and in kexin sedolisin [Acidobacteriota bacterium]